ncbi:hypothetical protein [Nonomuraea bangladeshensis]|uniref:hypothetical protein n=1 Tax=Nonomuraea bangladeshensis TaxID=404385 RepID=UPI0031CEE1FA
MADRKDELAERRFAKLVDQLKAMMTAGLKPEYRGFYGQLILTHDAVIELGELADLRWAARAAGRRLGWRVRTHVADNGTLFIIDDRDPPQEIPASWQAVARPRPSRPSSPASSTRPACFAPASPSPGRTTATKVPDQARCDPSVRARSNRLTRS